MAIRTDLDKTVQSRLHQMESITDTALGQLDLDELLHELLGRVVDILEVDTAAVLLLDPLSSELVATAARGLEEEIRQGVRIPVGRGFAGRVAAERRPVIIDEVDHTNVLNPILRQRGVRSLLGVPLVTSGAVTGVLHIGTLTPRRFTEDDAHLLQLVADRIGLATQARISQREREAVVALQRSLLPARLPTIPGLDFAARYIPGDGGAVGGDWYDVFAVPSGRVWIVIGDVVGRGLRAAVVMGRLRSALRAYAIDGGEPSDVLTRLNRKLRHFEPGEMATALVACFDPALDALHLSLAGHPAPVLALPDAPPRQLDVAVDAPLGMASDAPRRTHRVPTPPGSVLCLFTDGLVERRGMNTDDRVRLLRDTVTIDDPEQVCARVMSTLVGNVTSNDDIAVLVVKHEVELARLEMLVPADPAVLRDIRAAARRWLPVVGATADDTNDVLLALGEACANAVEHAYGARAGTIHVTLETEGSEIVMTIRDTGEWRAPRGRNRGRGLYLIEQCSDHVRIDRTGAGTAMTIRRRIGHPATRDT
jgi:serine phosphatase RsbU (regulator of sigma subunit)